MQSTCSSLLNYLPSPSFTSFKGTIISQTIKREEMRGGEGERLFIDMVCQGRRRGRKRRARRKERDDQLSWDTYYLSAQHWANDCKGTNYRFISNHRTGAFCSNPIHCSILTAPSDSLWSTPEPDLSTQVVSMDLPQARPRPDVFWCWGRCVEGSWGDAVSPNQSHERCAQFSDSRSFPYEWTRPDGPKTTCQTHIQ